MAEWTKNNPSSIVRLVLNGNEDLAKMYVGSASTFLYVLKNRMSTGGIESLSHNHILPDGTIINVSSSFGVDQIMINSPSIEEEPVVPTTEEGTPSCNIIFVKMPKIIQPMHNPGRIAPGEVEGVDYIKTFFKTNLKNCPGCSPVQWLWAYRFKKPVEPLHFHNYSSIIQMGVKPGEDDPDNHLVYSLNPPPFIEIIKRGTDDSGGYITWKAYTESPDPDNPGSNVGISRTGEAVVLIVARLYGPDGNILCSKEQKVLIDCCKKDQSIRNVGIWWEDSCTCQPFIMYPTGICDALCLAPILMPMGGTAGLIWYACTFPQQAFYSIPDIKGVCLPVTWTLTGPIDFWYGTDLHSNTIMLRCLEGGCNETASITLTDRCGNVYHIDTTPCCMDAAELTINYTSLQMSCSGKQTFSTSGGCGPYTWSCGTGTIDQGGNYTAPSTNSNCGNNDTVTVTDCCGNSATCQIAVNCYSGADISLEMITHYNCCCYKLVDQDCGGVGYNTVNAYYIQKWRCDGVVLVSCWAGSRIGCPGGAACPPPPPCTNYCACNPSTDSQCWGDGAGNCGYASGSCTITTGPCDVIRDSRTAGMKNAGCCPLNPLTGLPY